MSGDEDLPRVLFLMGYGRSGSTFFDILLNNAADVTSVGALGHYWSWLGDGEPCACGERLEACELWGEVVRSHRERLSHPDPERWNAVQEAVEARRQLPRLLLGRLPAGIVTDYRRATGSLLRAIGEHTDAPAVVDSSGSGARSTGRAYGLARHTGADVRVIHLVRDGRAVAWSSEKRPGSPERPEVRLPPLMKALRAGLGWTFANLACEWITRALGPDRVLRVRYEDLVTETTRELERVAAFAGLALDDLIAKVEADEPLAVGHNIAGNRLRFRDEIRIRPDFSWRDAMPAHHRWAVTVELWPLLRRYGYLEGVRRAGAAAAPAVPGGRPDG